MQHRSSSENQFGDLTPAWTNEDELEQLAGKLLAAMSSNRPWYQQCDDAILSNLHIPSLADLIDVVVYQARSIPQWRSRVDKHATADERPSLRFDQCTFDSFAKRDDLPVSLYLRGCQIRGNFLLHDCFVRGHLWIVARVSGSVNSEDVFYFGESNYGFSVFEQDVSFRRSHFHEIADFGGCGFEDGAGFWSATMRKGGRFTSAEFRENAYFLDAKVEGCLDFTSSRFSKRILMGGEGMLSLKAGSSCRFRFYRMTLEAGATLEIDPRLVSRVETDKEMLRRWNTIRVRDWFVEYLVVVFGSRLATFFGVGHRGNFLQGEDFNNDTVANRKEMRIAASDYRRLRDVFRLQPGMDKLADICAWRHHELMRRSAEPERGLMYLVQVSNNLFSWFIKRNALGYLLQPSRILVSSTVVVLSCALVYKIGADPTTISFNGSGSIHESSVDAWQAGGNGWLSALYFSVTTFVTLGYGDFAPVGWFKLVTGFEALFGVSLLALFTVAWARKMVR